MAMSTGTRLGPYEILSPLAAGGMGEVYRARDPRMGCEVAIKLSAELFSDRFEREVRAVAALNHPNICHITMSAQTILSWSWSKGRRWLIASNKARSR
jgi:serine/threonine protein kinase